MAVASVVSAVPRGRAEALPDWLCSAGIALAAAGIVVQTTAHLVYTYAWTSAWFLSADRDDNAFAWASTVAAFGAALAAVCLFGLFGRRRLLVLALVLAIVSLDDIATVHERLALHGEEALDTAEFSRRYLWILIFLPLLALGLWLLVTLAREMAPRPRRLVLAGLALLALGVAAEAVTSVTFRHGYEEGTTVDAIEVVIEEGAELGGWILIAAALLAHFTQSLMNAANPAQVK